MPLFEITVRSPEGEYDFYKVTAFTPSEAKQIVVTLKNQEGRAKWTLTTIRKVIG